MKKIIFYFLALLLAVWLGIFMRNNPGYVLISTSDMRIETSLWFFIIALIFVFFVVYLLIRLGSGAGSVTISLTGWVDSRRKRRSRAQTILGLHELVEGNWKGAEKKLAKFAKHSDMPLINYLAAALMAERQREFNRRDNYLSLARKVAKGRPLTVKLAEVALRIGNGDWEKSLSILEELYKSCPKNNFVLELLQRVYLELEDWHGLKKILPILRKLRVLDEEEVDCLLEQVYGELLLDGEKDDKMEDVWNSLSRSLKKNPYLLAIYSEHLLNKGESEEAESLIKMILRKKLDRRLLNVYSSLTSPNPIKHLMRAEKWLNDKPNDVGLLLCLGRICRKQKLWGKSRHYLEESIKIEPTSIAYIELAELMAEQNDLRVAIDFYEKALKA